EDRPGVRALEVDARDSLTLHKLEADEILHEVVVPERATDLAVGDDLEAGLLLQLHRTTDSFVLDCLQLLRRNLLFGEALARLLDRSGAKQRSDMVGAVRRTWEFRHRFNPLLSAIG